MNTARDTAERGARMLDERVADWFMRVDLEHLDMSDPYRCVLGQVYGSYTQGCDALVLDTGINQGFETWTHSYAELDAAWTDLINTRRLEASVGAR